jgi:hypothetical protein
MRQQDGNPEENCLPGGVTEDMLKDAIERSGYPLQSSVVATVVDAIDGWDLPEGEAHTFVQEEWTYFDRDLDKTRALDALIESHRWSVRGDAQPRVRPVLSLLIECKKTELPFVFFTRDSTNLADFPVTSGFPHHSIELTTDDDPSTYSYPLTMLWGLRHHDFVTKPPAAVSVSSARRAGKKLEISGEDVYNGLALPLLKATDHLRSVSQFSKAHYTDGRLIVSAIVVRGPMVAVAEDGSGGPELVPWVRVHRYEPLSDESAWQSHRLAAFDVVHEDYLPVYLEKLHEYVDHFVASSMDCLGILLSGEGFAEALGHGAEPREIEPRTTETRAISRRLAAESALALVNGKIKPFGNYIRTPLRRAQIDGHEDEETTPGV